MISSTLRVPVYLSQEGPLCPNVYGTIGLDFTPYLKTGVYHPEWNLSDERKTEAFAAEENAVTRKRIYVSELLVGDDSANFEPQNNSSK